MPALCSFWSVSAEDAVLGPDVNNQSCGSSSFNVMAYLFTSFFFSLIVYVYFLVSHSAINIQRWLTDLLICRLSQVRNFPTENYSSSYLSLFVISFFVQSLVLAPSPSVIFVFASFYLYLFPMCFTFITSGL